jgi:hypothetical protein
MGLISLHIVPNIESLAAVVLARTAEPTSFSAFDTSLTWSIVLSWEGSYECK